MNKKRLRGFTLIEMLIVVVIIGILAAALIIRLQDTQGKARDVARKKDIFNMIGAVNLYIADNGKAPAAPVAAIYGPTFFEQSSSYAMMPITGGGVLQPYLSQIPADPQGSTNYAFNPKNYAYSYYGANFISSSIKSQFTGGVYGYFQVDNGKTFGFFSSVESYESANRWNGKVMHCQPHGGCYTAFYPIYVMAKKDLNRQLCNPVVKGDDSASSATVSDDMYASNTRLFRSCKTPYQQELIQITFGN